MPIIRVWNCHCLKTFRSVNNKSVCNYWY